MRLHRLPVAALNRAGQLEPVVDRAAHQGDETFLGSSRGAEQLRGNCVQRHEIIRCDCGTGVVERARLIRELEGPEPEELGQAEADRKPIRCFCSHRRPRPVELFGTTRAREGLQRMQREALSVRGECGERRGAGDVCHPGTGFEARCDLGDGGVRNAEQNDVALFVHGNPALAKAGGNGRADAAGADDLDCVEHLELQFRSGYRAPEAYRAAGTLAYLVGRRLLLGLLFAAVLVAPGETSAAIPLTPCKSGGVQCGTVTVPVDRTGVMPGTIDLHVEMLPATGAPRGAMFLIAGGPGQGSADSFDLAPGFTRQLMQLVFPNYTLITVDNRGTGKSALINCPGLQRATSGSAEQFAALAAACAAIIGPPRMFYSTRDHADDLEAVRAALGIEKVGLYGVSYGTKLSLAYALGHPAQVERLILDSVVPVQFPDPFDRNVLHELPTALQNFCAGGVCRGATTNYANDVVTLANRLAARPISGRIIGQNGKTKTVRMNGEELVTMMVDADLSPGLAAEAPAAVRAALRGNTRPLLRIYDLNLVSNRLTAEELSFGLNAATNCADGRFPWAPNTPPASRRATIDAAVAALPAEHFGRFGKWAARLGTAFYCEQWPTPAGNTPLGAGPLPNVPMVAINGGFDIRTPVANALAVVDQFPQGKLLVVNGVGHSVIGSDVSTCSWRYLREWILGTLNAPARAECSQRVLPISKVVTAFPRAQARRTAAQTLAVVGKTLREAQATFWFGGEGFRARGLYGGRLATAGNGLAFTLTRYSLTPGVLVSGRIRFIAIGPPSTFQGTVTISGSAALAGTVTIAKNGRITGRLGGKRVSGRY
jgi:pimeloyl-ACP methyl ester carboxylesterase